MAHARSQQLAAELRAVDAEQRRDTEGRRAAVAEAEVHVAVDRYARLKDVCSDLRARLDQRESALADAYGAEETRRNVTEPLAMQQLEEAKDQAKALEQSLAGRDERHKMLLDTLTALRRVLGERENRVRELTEHVARLESLEIPLLKEAEEAAREQAAAANTSIQGAELRFAELRQRFDEAQAHVCQLTTALTEAHEAKNMAEENAAQHAALAAAARREAILVAEQRRGEATRAEELFAELRGQREAHHSRSEELATARAELDASAELREAAEDAAELERQRARSHAFDLEMARDALADERSKLQRKEAELLARNDQISTLNELLEAARAKVRARSDRADELHAHLRQAALEGEARATELAAAHGRITSVREQLARANARVVEVEQALAAHVDAGNASQREQKAAVAKKAANEKAAAAKKAADEKAAADKAAAEKAAADKKAADVKAAAEKLAAEKAAAINAADAKDAAEKAAADSKREKAVVDLRQRLATAFATVALGPAEEAKTRSEELRRRIDTHWALLWSRVDLGYVLRNLSPLRLLLQAEPTAIAMLGDALKPHLDVLVGVYLKLSARDEAHGEGVVLNTHGEGVVLNSWSDLVMNEARWADGAPTYEVAKRIFQCVLDGRTRLDNVASPLARKLGDPRLSLPEFLQALVLLAVDRKLAVGTSSAAAVADDALDVVGDAVAGDMVPVIKPTRAGSGSVHWQPTTDDRVEPRTPRRASLSVYDLIIAVKQTVSEMTAASTNADTPNLAHVLTCRERWVSDASLEGLRLHAVRRLLEPMLLHLFKQIEAKQAAYGEGGGSAPLSSPLAVFEYLVDSARFASSTRKLEPRLVYLCAAALHDRAEPHPLDQPVGPVLAEAVVRYACRNGADEPCDLGSLALTCAQLLAPWLVPTSESDLPGLREQLELVLAAKSPPSATNMRGEDPALGRADKPGRGFLKHNSILKGLGAGDGVLSWIPQPVHKGEARVWVKLESHVRDNSSPMFETRHPDNARDFKTTWPYHEEDFEKADMCEMLNIDEPNILRSELLQP